MTTIRCPAFLASELGPQQPGQSLFHIVPAPFEKSVSYGRGAARGPAAILTASQQLEAFDGVGIPAEHGIYTHTALACRGSAEEALAEISVKIAEIAELGKIPVLLGGEHTVTLGALAALAARHGRFGVVQFDAHADLRESYQGSPLSHACVMRRVLELGLSLYQIGVRSLSHDEEMLRRQMQLGRLDAAAIAAGGISEIILPGDFPRQIYITIDVDALDPSIMPATGTPEPGGLSWHQMQAALSAVIRGRRVLGFDVVELAPIPGLHAPDYTAARLIYNLLGMVVRSSCTVTTD